MHVCQKRGACVQPFVILCVSRGAGLTVGKAKERVGSLRSAIRNLEFALHHMQREEEVTLCVSRGWR